MKNYEEKEKKLKNVLEKLNSMSSEVAKMNESIHSLNMEKNQLLREKEDSQKNFENLLCMKMISNHFFLNFFINSGRFFIRINFKTCPIIFFCLSNYS